MLKTLTAIGISAAIVFAPLAAIAQTDAAPAGAAPAASDAAAPAADSMKKAKPHHHAKPKKTATKNEEAGGGRRDASRSGRSAEELSRRADDKAKFEDMSRPIARMGRFFVS